MSLARPSLLGSLSLLLVACTGDDGATDGATTGATAATMSTSEATTTAASEATTTAASETTTEATTTEATTTEATTTEATTTEATTTGPGGPPDYPAPGGMCPDGTAQVIVGDGQHCAPFCAGEGAACPSEGLGDATSTCEPFTNSESGSGQSCAMGEACPAGEGCDSEGACHTIVFWSCLIDCGPGGSCPEPMFCTSQDRCGHPL